jgi:hypothetical protein
MSLNGLDDPKIKEAHETAVAEPGGWYVLKQVEALSDDGSLDEPAIHCLFVLGLI